MWFLCHIQLSKTKK
uniref:Uncharacterized protein n=1 Tax=Flavobacterium psychrophilum TaxID=96345 RepID=Q7WS82_FLAPS|nr:hypothetical protein [Flavobacterium psychrophilum]BAC76959.1 hypothetical protein [Flavobacterium psychrophilum]